MFILHPRERACGIALLAALVLPVCAYGSERKVERSAASWAKQLEVGDRDGKREATYHLSKLGEGAKDALPALIQALGDNDKQVWSNAIAALANLGPAAEPAIPVLLESMDSKKGRSARRMYERQQVLLRSAFVLSRIGAPAIPALKEALKGDDTGKRIGAAKALGGMQAAGAVAVPDLISNLNHGDQELRREVVDALASIGVPAVKQLIQALSSPEKKIREGAAESLGQIGRVAGEAAGPLLVMAEKDQDMVARAAALGSLSRVNASPEKAVPLLLAAIRSNDEPLRHAATNALLISRAYKERAVPALTGDLNNADQGRRTLAAQILGRMHAGAKAAVPKLIESAKKEPGEPAYSSALAQIGDPALGPIMKELTASAGKAAPQREWIFRALREMGSPAMSALVPALNAKDAAVRAGAARALEGMLLAPKTVERLLALATDSDATVRAAALPTLAAIRTERGQVIPKLEAALQDAAPEVRRAAAVSLASIGAVTKIGPAGLVELLDEPDKEIQRSAVESLGSLRGVAGPAVPALIERLKDPELEGFILEALSKIGKEAEKAVPSLVGLMKSGSTATRLGAIQALGNVAPAGDESVLPVLYNALKERGRDMRATALQALVKVENNEDKLLQVIADGLKDQSALQRRLAAQSAKRFGERGEILVPSLFKMLDIDTERNAALNALRSIPVRDVQRLVSVLTHKDPNVRIFACNALGKLGADARETLPELDKLATGGPDNVQAAARKAIQAINKAAQSTS